MIESTLTFLVQTLKDSNSKGGENAYKKVLQQTIEEELGTSKLSLHVFA
jgi:hypothetical protein